ncbi:MAG: outer membrane lipoprotein-sorting protein [Fibrobacteria bacterium]|nr:outer membrane lipoprotein-sorting protein [Fibrobacteria bacterium]
MRGFLQTSNLARIVVFVSASCMGMEAALPAGSAAARGEWVARRSIAADSGFKDASSGLLLQIIEPDGRVMDRNIELRALEVPGDGEKTLMLFRTPRDVAGSAFLTHSHADGTDEQWLFLSALKRVKRISSSNRGGSFFGSEFAFEDLSSMELGRFRYEFLGEEGGAYKVRLSPTDAGSVYREIDAWYDKATFRVERMELAGKRDGLGKTMRMTGYRLLNDKYWRPDTIEMENRGNGRRSRFVFTGYKVGVGLEPSLFLPSRIENAR